MYLCGNWRSQTHSVDIDLIVKNFPFSEFCWQLRLGSEYQKCMKSNWQEAEFQESQTAQNSNPAGEESNSTEGGELDEAPSTDCVVQMRHAC